MTTTEERLVQIEARAGDALRNRELYGKGSRSRRIANEESAKDTPWLLDLARRQAAALSHANSAMSNHYDYQIRREAKFGRAESSCVCEICQAMPLIREVMSDE